MAESKIRTIPITLDHVPQGTEEENVNWRKKGRIPLPEGVTGGSIAKDILRIAWPSVIELLLMQLASMVDLMMVGHLGSEALAAVGLTTQPIFMLISIGVALNVGATALIAQSKGAGNREKANKVLSQAIVLMFYLSLLMSILGYAFSRELVVFMGAKEDTVEDATIYMQIRSVGMFFASITACITASLRGVGDSKTALVYNSVANVVNVIFNYLLIYGKAGFPEMRVAGAALATVIGQVLACFMAFYAVMQKKRARYLLLNLKEGIHLEKAMVMGIIAIGFPAMVEQIVMRIGSIIFSKTVADLGTLSYATHNVCMNIMALSFMIGQAFAVSATSLVGQSLGKKRGDMARAYAVKSSVLGIYVSILLAIFFAACGGFVVSLYSDEAQVISEGAMLMWFVAFMQPFQAIAFILAGGLRGAGDTKSIAWITMIAIIFFRTGLALLFVKVFNWGIAGAWIAMSLEQVVRTILIIWRYNTRKWMTMTRQRPGAPKTA